MPSDRLRASLLGWLLKVLAYGGSVLSASVLLWLFFRRDRQGKEGDDWYEIKPREDGDEAKDGVPDSVGEKIPLTDDDEHKIPDGDADGPIGEPPDVNAKKPKEGDAGFPSNGKVPKHTTGSQTDLTLPTSDDADTEEDRPLLQAAGDKRPKRPKQSDETQTDFDDLDPSLSPSPLKDFKFVDDYSPKDESGLPGSRPAEPRPQSSDFYRVREGPAKYRPASYLIAVGAKDEDAEGPKEGQPGQGDAVDGRMPSDEAGNGQTSPSRMGGAVPSVQSDDSGVQLDDAGNLHPPGTTLRTITRETYEYRVSGVKRAAWFKGEAAPEDGKGEAGKPIDKTGEGVGDTSGDEGRPPPRKQTDGTQTDFDAVEPISLSDESLLKSHDKVPSDPDKVHQYQGLAQKLTRAYLESEGRQQNDDAQGLSTSDESWYTPETEFYPSSGGEQGLPFYDASYTSPAKRSSTPKRSPSSGEASLLDDDVSGGGKATPETGMLGVGKRKSQQADQVPSDDTSEPRTRHIPRDKGPSQKSTGGSQTDLNELELSRVAWGIKVDDDDQRAARSDDDEETPDRVTSGHGRPAANEDEQRKDQGRPVVTGDGQKKGKVDRYGIVKIETSVKREYSGQDGIVGAEEQRPGETDEIRHPDIHDKAAQGKDRVEDGSRPTDTEPGREQRPDSDEYDKPLAGSGIRLVKQTTTVRVDRKVQPLLLTQSSAQTEFDDKVLEDYLGLRHGALKHAGPEEDSTGRGGEGEKTGLPAIQAKAGERLDIHDQLASVDGRSGFDEVKGRSIMKHRPQGNVDLRDKADTDQRKQQLDHRFAADGRPPLQDSGQVRPSADEHLPPSSARVSDYRGPVSEEEDLDPDSSDRIGGHLAKRLQWDMRAEQGVDQYGEPIMDASASQQGKLKQYGQSPTGDVGPIRYGLPDRDGSGGIVDQYGRPLVGDVHADERKYAQIHPSMYEKKGSTTSEDALRGPLGKDESLKGQLGRPHGPLTSEQDVRQASGVITGRGLKQLAFDLHGRPIDELHPDYGRLPSDRNSKACQAGVSVTRLLRDYDYKVYGRPMGTAILTDDGRIQGIAATISPGKEGATLTEADRSDVTGPSGQSAESITSKEPSKQPRDADEVHPSKRPSILDELDSMMAKANAALSSAERRLSELQTDDQEPPTDDSTEQRHPRDSGDQDLSRLPTESTGAAGKGVPPHSTTKDKSFPRQQVEPLSEFAQGKGVRRHGETDSKDGAREIANADLASPIAGDVATDREPYTPSSPADVASSGAGESETDDSTIGTPPDAAGKDQEYKKSGYRVRTPTSPFSSTNVVGKQISSRGEADAGPPHETKHGYISAISPKEESPKDKRTPSPGVVQVLDASLAASGDRTTERSDREVIRGEQPGEDEPLLGKKSSPIETSPADQVDAAGTGASPSAGSPVDEAAQKAAEALTLKAAGDAAAKSATENEIDDATLKAAKHKTEEEAAILASKKAAEEDLAKAVAKESEKEAAKEAVEEVPAKTAEEDAAAAAKATEEAAKRKAEDEADRRAAQMAAEDEAARRDAEESAKEKAGKDAKEASKRKAEQEAAMSATQKVEKKAAEEESVKEKADKDAVIRGAAKHKDDEEAAEEEAARKAAEEAAKRKADEETAKRKAEEESALAAAKKAEEEASGRKAAEEAAKRKAEEDSAKKAAEEAAKRKAEGEAAKAATTKEEEAEAARKAAEEAVKGKAQKDTAKKAAEEAAKQKAEEEAAKAAAKKAEEAAAKKAAEEAAKRKTEEDAAKKAAEEAAKRKAEEESAKIAAEEAAKRKAEEDAAKHKSDKAAKAAAKEAEEDAARKAAEEAAKRKAAEAAAIVAAKKAEEDAARNAAEEAAKRKAEEDAVKKAAEEAAKRKAEEEAAMAAAKKAEEESAKKAAEEAAKKKTEEDAAKKAAEEAVKRKAAEEASMAAAKRAEEEPSRKAAEEAAKEKAEEAAKKKAEEDAAKKAAEEAAKRKAEEEAAKAAAKKAEEETAARKAAEEAAKKKAEEEAAKKAAEEAAKRKAEEQAAKAAAKKAEEDAARKAAEEAAKKKAEEDAAKKSAEEAAKRKAEEEAAKAAAKKAEEEAARKAAEEAAKKKAEEDAAKRKAEEEAAMAATKKAEEEAAKKAAEEAAKRKAEEDAAKRKADEEAAKAAAKKAEEEAARKAAEETAKRKAEEEAAKKAAEEAAKRKAEEEAAIAAAKRAEEEAARKAAEEAAKKKAEEDAAKKAAEEAAKRKAEEEAAMAATKKAEEEAAKKAAEEARKAAGELNKKAESRSKPRIEDDISRKSAEEDVQGREPGAYVAAEEATKITPEEAAQMGAADEAAAKARAEEQAAAEKRAAEEEKAARLTAAEAAKKEAEESAKKKASEELAAKIATEDAAQKAVEAEPAKLTGKAAKKAAKEAAKKKEAEEKAAKKAAEEAKKKREAEEKAAKKAAEEEAKKKAAEEKAAKKAAEAAAKKAAQEASKKKSDKELAAKKAEEDAARKAAEEQAKAEEEAKKAAEEAAKKAEEEAARKAAEEAAKKKAEEEAARKAAEEAAKKKAEEEAARRAEQEAAKQAEEAAKKAAEAAKKQATEPSAKKALEDLVAKKTAEEEKAAEANGVSDQNPLQAEEKELKSFYREAGNNVQPIPWMEDFKVDLDDVNMDLSIENQPRISALRTPRQQKRVSGTEGRPRTPDAGKTIRIDEIFDPLTNIRGKKGEPPKRILIRGQPGIGKSTLCRKLAYDWSNPENETGTIKKFKYTFLIEGRHLGGDLKNAMAEQLLSQGFNDTPENLWKFVEDNQNDVLFIVDGYDEIDTSVKSDVGDLISKKILPQSTLVITSRPESTKEISRSVDKSLKVEGFNQEKSADFVNKHFHVTSPNTEHAPDVTENLVAALRRDKNLQQLAAYPLCNAYLCALWEDTEGDVPTTKSSLYDRLKIVVTRRYCLKQGVPLPAKSSDVPAQFRSYYRALGELAYNGVTNNKVLFDKPLVLHKVRDPRVLQMGLLLEEHSIARTKRHEYYRFPHKAFQEFFAAQYLSEMSEYVRSPTYPKLVKDRVWRDIVLFLPGALKQQPRDLIPLFKALSEYNNTRKSTYSDVGQYRLSLDTLFEAELQDTYSTIVAPSLPSLLTESHPIIEGVSSPTLQGLACVLKQNNIDVKEFRFGVWTEKYDQNCDTLTEALNDNQTVGKLVIAACNENDVVESVKDILARLAERNNTVKSLQIIDYSYKGPLKYDERIEMLRKVCTIEEIKIDSAARVWYPGLPQNPSEAQHTIRSTPMTPMSTD
ncbi:uncharacterized protein LOC144880256 isoform X3 [Branchiostoma floridae x Branchiostoma japonicum]